MSNLCAYPLAKTAAFVGLLIILAALMTSLASADSPASAPANPPTTQQASEDSADPVHRPIPKNENGQLPLNTLKSTGPNTTTLLHQMLALVIVILVLGGACWYFLKKGLPRLRVAGSGRSKNVSVLETTYLHSRQSVYLLQVGTKKLLVTGGREGLRMLADVTDGFPERETEEDFQAVLDREKNTEPQGDRS